MLLQVHDELIFDACRRATAENIPFPVDCRVMEKPPGPAIDMAVPQRLTHAPH